MSRATKYQTTIEEKKKAYHHLYAALHEVQSIETPSINLNLISVKSGLSLDKSVTRHEQSMHLAHANFLTMVEDLPAFLLKLIHDYALMAYTKDDETEWSKTKTFYAAFIEALDQKLSANQIVSETEPTDQSLEPNFWLLNQLSGGRVDVRVLTAQEKNGYSMRYILSFVLSHLTGEPLDQFKAMNDKEIEDCLFDNDMELAVVGAGQTEIYMIKNIGEYFGTFDTQLKQFDDINQYFKMVQLCLSEAYDVTATQHKDIGSNELGFFAILEEGIASHVSEMHQRVEARQLAVYREFNEA